MKKVFRYLATRPRTGQILELIMTTFWILSLRVKLKYRVLDKNLFDPKSAPNYSQPEINFSCRNFLMPGFSGVNVWIESFCRALTPQYRINIFCQGRNLIKPVEFHFSNISIFALPLFTELRLTDVPLYDAWTRTLKAKIESDPAITNVFSPFSGVESVGLWEIPGIKSFTLLVTDERSHRFPKYSRRELRDLRQFDRRTLAIIEKEREILSSPNSHLIGDSTAVIRDLEALYEINISERAIVVPISLSSDECLSVQKEKIILFIGRSDSRKGLANLLDAWELIWILAPDWKLIVATSGGDDPESFGRAQKFIQNGLNCELLVNINEQEKHELLNMSSILALPSLYESFGIVALESMQHGCTTVASHVGGLPEVLGSAAVYFEPGSSLDLAKKLLWTINNSRERHSISDQGKLRIRNLFSDEALALQFLGCFTS